MFWIVLIIIVGIYSSIRFFISYHKDKEDLHGQTLGQKFGVIVNMINNEAFDGQGVVTILDEREINLYEEGKNQIINFQYSTGHLTITWKYKYFEKEMVKKWQFDNVRNLSIFEQENIGSRMIEEMNELVRNHKDVVLKENKITFNSNIPEKDSIVLKSRGAETYEEEARDKFYIDENYNGALEIINSGLQIDENKTSPDLFLLRAKCNFNLKNYKEALVDVNKSLNFIIKDKRFNYHMWDCLSHRSQINYNLGFSIEGAIDWSNSQKYFERIPKSTTNDAADDELVPSNEEIETLKLIIVEKMYNLASEAFENSPMKGTPLASLSIIESLNGSSDSFEKSLILEKDKIKLNEDEIFDLIEDAKSIAYKKLLD